MFSAIQLQTRRKSLGQYFGICRKSCRYYDTIQLGLVTLGSSLIGWREKTVDIYNKDLAGSRIKSDDRQSMGGMILPPISNLNCNYKIFGITFT